jgi:hypothetical protein
MLERQGFGEIQRGAISLCTFYGARLEADCPDFQLFRRNRSVESKVEGGLSAGRNWRREIPFPLSE